MSLTPQQEIDTKQQINANFKLPYTALLGDPKHYWFLNNRFLKKGKLLS